jgi:septal ring factor EnvC (AmiA/AmiB activator)
MARTQPSAGPGASIEETLATVSARARAEREIRAAAGRNAAGTGEAPAERRVALARRVQAAERRVAEAEDEAREATLAATAARREVAARAEALAPLLPLMHRLAVWPAESLLTVPASPEEALRGLLVLRSLTRGAAEQMRALRDAAGQSRRRDAAAEAGRRQLSSVQGEAEAEAAALDAELEIFRRQRPAELDAAAEAVRRAAQNAARAATLQDALARLRPERSGRPAAEAEGAGRKGIDGTAAAQGRAAGEGTRDASNHSTSPALRPAALGPEPRAAGPRPSLGRGAPVAGQLVRDFGKPGDDGLPARGLTWQAAAQARVVSPCSGRVVFAAPFRSYGQLVILDCGGQQHFVLAGLGRLDVVPGQPVITGEPVGQLPGEPGRGRATLYGELRLRGQPADPGPWLSGRGG